MIVYFTGDDGQITLQYTKAIIFTDNSLKLLIDGDNYFVIDIDHIISIEENAVR